MPRSDSSSAYTTVAGVPTGACGLRNPAVRPALWESLAPTAAIFAPVQRPLVEGDRAQRYGFTGGGGPVFTSIASTFE